MPRTKKSVASEEIADEERVEEVSQESDAELNNSTESTNIEEVTFEDEISSIDEKGKDDADDFLSDSVDKTEYIISNKMLSLIESAIYRKMRLTGILVGVERTRNGIVANAIFNSDSDDLLYDSVTVKISAENMGIDNKAIEKHIRQQARKMGVEMTPELFENRKRKLQFELLSTMLGAKIDFVPYLVDTETNAVVASRVEAMNQKRRFIVPSEDNPMPSLGVGDREIARIIRVSPVALVVEVSGFEVTMNASQITPMAINLSQRFKVGDSIRVIIKEVRKNGLTVISTVAERVDAKRKIHEYKQGTITMGTVYHRDLRTGKYYLRMPNGCRGICYFEKSVLRTNPRVGDNVRVFVTGYTPSGTAVRCQIRAVM